jgi:hypothetical protein
MKESILEPLLRRMHIRRVLPYIREHRHCRLLGIGCGWESRFLKVVEPYIESGVGIDFRAPLMQEGKIRTERLTLEDLLPNLGHLLKLAGFAIRTNAVFSLA